MATAYSGAAWPLKETGEGAWALYGSDVYVNENKKMAQMIFVFDDPATWLLVKVIDCQPSNPATALVDQVKVSLMLEPSNTNREVYYGGSVAYW